MQTISGQHPAATPRTAVDSGNDDNTIKAEVVNLRFDTLVPDLQHRHTAPTTTPRKLYITLVFTTPNLDRWHARQAVTRWAYFAKGPSDIPLSTPQFDKAPKNLFIFGGQKYTVTYFVQFRTSPLSLNSFPSCLGIASVRYDVAYGQNWRWAAIRELYHTVSDTVNQAIAMELEEQERRCNRLWQRRGQLPQ